MASRKNGDTTRRGSYGQYTTKQRKSALGDAEKLGIREAATKHDIPTSTLGYWWRQKHGGSATAPRPSVSTNRTPDAPTAPQGPGKRIVAKSYTPSLKAEILEHAAKKGVTAASRKYKVSRFSHYSWQRQVRLAAEGKGDSPTAGPAPAEIETQRDREILDDWHRHPGLGPSQIRNQLRRKNVKVSVQTARRVMEESGYRPPKVKRQGHDERFEAVRPNHLWHLDYVHRFINRTGVHTLILLDDHSRFVVGHGTDDAERADMVIDTFEQAVRRHGKPEMVIHNKGAAFWSWRGIARFTALLTELGVDQITAEHKEWNGKLEVFNGNLHKELFDQQRFYDVAEMRRRLGAHLHWYNHQRTSHALGGLLVPADRFYGRADEVLARIEAGAGREGLDTLDLRDRCLELFKVASQGGIPEVWLIGQKILELKKE
ncbi:MAG: DDE-type integrase/transposase/recombinase [Polyangia bacterium]|jgi:putative transposase|nr:DDE-type integrase/transposase/recombinase [Polyangia bacterium]